MTLTKIEQAYQLVLDNTHDLQTALSTHFFDALIEQNASYLGEEAASEHLAKRHQALRDLKLSAEDWRRVYQFLLIKGSQTDKLQPNHQFTPDSLGFILLFLIEVLTDKPQLDVLEIGSGTGNLALTLLSQTSKQLTYTGIELDDLLIDLSASMAEIAGLPLTLVQGDAVRPQHLPESDVILSDLPVGYYPDEEIASRYQVAATGQKTYAHHLLMEQSLKYLKPGGLAIFLAPNNLLTSPQADLLKQWLSDYANILGVITLPDNLFAGQQLTKSIFILQKQAEKSKESFIYPLTDLKDPDALRAFMKALRTWKSS
ncbi:class I SAM-dependent methyltransferase [Streptococcus entericus]|uniref:class I SAM-dependent methyltransferase n=1 Tax=Streptococcus entericus TaxID=155680 RepID=UPI00037BDEE3|nr:class I SAM-dependent methyltransferase [Streptococcus entericus]